MTIGNLSNDILAGDYAAVTFDGADHVRSVIRYGTGTDLIASIQDSLFTVGGANGPGPIFGSLYNPRFNALGGSSLAGGRLGEILSFSSISGVDYTHGDEHVEGGGQTGNPNSTASDANNFLNELPATAAGEEGANAPDKKDGQSPSAEPGEQDGQEQQTAPEGQEGESAPTNHDGQSPSGKQGGPEVQKAQPPADGKKGAPAPAKPGDASPPGEKGAAAQPGGQAPGTGGSSAPPTDKGAQVGKPAPKPAAGAEGPPQDLQQVAANALGVSARDQGGRLELAVAGLLGVQALHSGQQAGASYRPNMPAVSDSDGRSSAAWVRSDAGRGNAGAKLLLDRRARRRDAASPRIASGAIEKTAHNWLDGALGMHTSVETCSYEAGTKPGLSIDWGESPKPGIAADAKVIIKPQKAAR
ncbi:MAG: hypothetical protein WC830_21695 [Burkholderiales bacterium]